MLWERMSEPCEVLRAERVPDGEGGFKTAWKPAGSTYAAIVHGSSSQAVLADGETSADAYAVTTVEPLAFHDVLERADGTTLRVVSEGSQLKAPDVATFAFFQCQAARWAVPDED